MPLVVFRFEIPAATLTTGMIRRFVRRRFEMPPDSIVQDAPIVDAR